MTVPRHILSGSKLFLPLNHNFKLETFENDVSNQSALKAARIVSDHPGSLNPLIITGEVGIGKTHLLHAIGNAIRTASPECNVYYTSADRFNYEAIETDLNDFKQVDVFLVDALQFMSGRHEIQASLIAILSMLLGSQKQVVIGSSLPPQLIPNLNESLLDLLADSHIVEINTPGFDARLKILERIAYACHIALPHDTACRIASTETGCIRAMEGLLIKLNAYCKLKGISISDEALMTLMLGGGTTP